MKTQILTSAVVIAVLALAVIPVSGARNASTSSKVGTELVWGNNVQWRMTVPPAPVPHNSNIHAQENFYVVAPQFPPAHQSVEVGGDPPFHHDHVIPIPAHNQGGFDAVWHAFIVVCTPAALSSGSCVPTMTDVGPPGVIPLAQMVNGQHLTADSTVDAAVASGAVALVDTGVVFVCPIHPLQD